MYPLGDVPDRVLRSSYPVLLDGRLLGYLPRRIATVACDKLRILKIKDDDDRFDSNFQVRTRLLL